MIVSIDAPPVRLSFEIVGRRWPDSDAWSREVLNVVASGGTPRSTVEFPMKVELPAFRLFRTQLQRAYDDLVGSINVRLPLYEDVVTLEGEMNHLGHVILHVTLRYRPDSELLSTLQFKMDIDQSSFPVIIQQIDTIIAEYSS